MTPPEDLLQQLRRNADTWLRQITIAYQAGADHELEACAKWLSERTICMDDQLRSARRPKLSLKEQALDALREAESSGCLYVNNRSDTIRQALEALPND